MGRTLGIVLLVAAAMADCEPAAFGATLTTTVSVGATYDMAGNVQSSTGLINDGAPHILRFDFFSQVSGLSPSQSYGAEEFNITLSGSLSRNSITVPGPALTTPKPSFVVNDPPLSNIASGLSFSPIPSYFAGGSAYDGGMSATDLVAIQFIVFNYDIGNTIDATTIAPVPDPRQTIGVGAPFRLGSLYVNWNGSLNGTLTVRERQFTTVDLQTHHFDLPVQFLPDVQFVFPIPEPAGCCLAGLGTIGLLIAARRKNR